MSLGVQKTYLLQFPISPENQWFRAVYGHVRKKVVLFLPYTHKILRGQQIKFEMFDIHPLNTTPGGGRPKIPPPPQGKSPATPLGSYLMGQLSRIQLYC